MKILFPVGSFYPAQTGGPDNTVYWITKALKKRQQDPIVVSTNKGLKPNILTEKWLEKEYAKVNYTKNKIHYFPIPLIKIAYNQLKNADILHLTMIFYPASFIMAILNRFFYKRPIIWSVRGDLDPHMLERSSWKKKPILFLIKNFLRSNVTFHTTCNAETAYLKNKIGEDIEVIQLANYMELPEKLEIVKQKYLLYLGRIDSKKAIENLIEGINQSQKFLDSDYVLKIAGDYKNPYGLGLVKLVEQYNLKHKIQFLGHVEGLEKQKILAAAYFLIMPSHTENFGIVVAEALSQGTPAVASTGTPWQLLVDYKCGFWIDNTPEKISTTVDLILEMDTTQYQEYATNGRRLVENELDIYHNIEKWILTYKQLLKSRST